MKEQVICLKSTYRDRLGSVRHIPGWKAALDAGTIWLKGPLHNSAFQKLLSALPAAACYILDSEQRLFPAGKPTPVCMLPVLPWQNLQDFVPLELPISAMPGQTNLRVPVKLKRSAIEREICAIQITVNEWKSYAVSVPEIRLNQLRYAVSVGGVVLVMGSPLPVLQGKLYWNCNDSLLPAGYDFDPPYIAALLSKTKDLAVFDELGNYDMIPQAAFAAPDRGSIRLLTS